MPGCAAFRPAPKPALHVRSLTALNVSQASSSQRAELNVGRPAWSDHCEKVGRWKKMHHCSAHKWRGRLRIGVSAHELCQAVVTQGLLKAKVDVATGATTGAPTLHAVATARRDSSSKSLRPPMLLRSRKSQLFDPVPNTIDGKFEDFVGSRAA
jgi:hypothetical protein